MEGKGSFFILLFIVALLTLTLAVLAGYLFFVADSSKPAVQTTQQAKTIIPSEDKLERKMLFESKNVFNLKNDDDKKIAVIQVNVELVYYKQVKGVKEVAKLLEAYDGEIKEIIGTYFQNMTLEDVKDLAVKEKAKKDLTKQINEKLTAAEKEKNDIVYTVNFPVWFYQ